MSWLALITPHYARGSQATPRIIGPPYIAGAFPVLARERNVSFVEGADILVKSTVPEGKGVSSSAALEIASMQALVAAYDLKIAATDLALLCQKVENLIAGAPCGVMDQMTSMHGEANQLLELLCQPADLKGTIPSARRPGNLGDRLRYPTLDRRGRLRNCPHVGVHGLSHHRVNGRTVY